MPTVANAYVQIMPSMEGATDNITKAILPDIENASTQGGNIFGKGFLGSLKGPLMGAGAVLLGALGVKEIISGLMDIGNEFKNMENTIIIGTGASGEALDSLCESAKNIAKTVPTSFSDAGDIVQDLNTRLGMTTADLEETGKRVVAIEKMLGSSVDMSKLTGTMNAFGIANDQVAAKMDYLFGVAQSTGIGFNDLTGILESNAPVLMNLGFSFEQSANMAGLLDKAGMDANGTMSKMSKALLNLAAPGQSAQDAFRDVISEMEGYIKAGDTAAALDIASKVFGTKGATQFVAALQSGAFSLDEIADAALGAGDGIMGTYQQTMTAADKFEVLKNKAAAALEPIASKLIDAVIVALDWLCDAFEYVAPAIEAVANAVGAFVGWLGQGIQAIGDFCSNAAGLFSGLGESAASIFGGIVDSTASAFETIKSNMISRLESAQESAVNIANTIGNALGFPGLGNIVSGVFEGVKNFIQNPIQTARDFIGNAIETIKGFFNFEFKWPKIPLPHFSISGSVNPIDWFTKGLPQVSIEWYAKGGIVEGAQIIGVGEAGPEAIVPLTRPNIAPFAEAVVETMGGTTTSNNQTFNIYTNDPNKVAAVVSAKLRRSTR